MYVPAVKLSGVSKRYGHLTAVDYLDLEVKRGEILGLLDRMGRVNQQLENDFGIG